MRKLLPAVLVLLLFSAMLLTAAASAQALTLPPGADPIAALAAGDDAEAGDDEGEVEDEGEADDEGDDEGDNEGEDCGREEDELCDEKGEAEVESAEACLLKAARASFTAAPGAGEVRLRVHYRAFEPTAVVVDAGLRGTKGSLHLGATRARFHQAGVYRYDFRLGSKQMVKAVAARELTVDLRAVGTRAECALHLATRAPRRPR